MTKTIIFDADGMIVHGERFSSRLARDYGISTDTTNHFFRNEFQQCLVGKADLKEELTGYLNLWGWKDGVEALLEYWFAEPYNEIDSRFEPVIRALRQKGIKVYLATNNDKYRTDNLMKQRGLNEWFDGVFSSAYMGHKKPDVEFFQAILDQIGITREDIVVWDDDSENTDSAAVLGIPSEVYKDFNGFKQYADALLQ
jgi:putative hydrolase of the HAD superfamily